MPRLEGLFLNFNDLQIFTPPGHLEPLELPLLRDLEIYESHASVTEAFLRHVKFPRLRYANFETSMGNEDISDYSPIIRTVLSVRAKGDFGDLSRLNISTKHFQVSPNCIYDWADSQSLWLMTGLGSVCSNTDEKGSVRFVCSVMAEIAAFPGDPASTIVSLSISVALTSEQLVALFGHLPHLETIDSSVPSKAIIQSLKISHLHPAKSPFPFPKLNTITIDRYAKPSPAFLDDFCDCLMMRSEYGAAVDNLSVGWKLTARDVQRLRELVVNFEVRARGWHGKYT